MKLTPEDAGRMLAKAMDGQVEQIRVILETPVPGHDWTTTKPTVPGWYWGYRPCDMCGPENQVIPIRCHPGTGDPPVVTAPNGYGTLREVTHFFGPLTVPEPPEEDPGQHD